ncbi:MAG TPA: hypothetical protein VMB80_15565 [Candidatus Acidoferrum sp.]|nr:hypothetical protein [Candidatus Acidoferrum sp.]
MKASASGSAEPLHVSSSSDSHASASADTEASVAATASSGSGGVKSEENPRRDFRFTSLLDVEYSAPFNGEFQNITRFTIAPLCLENDRYCLGPFLSVDAMGLKPGTLPDNAIENATMLEAGMLGRYYLNHTHNFISPYFSGSLSAQLLGWDYRNPVYTSDGHKITSDSLTGMGVYAGFGVTFYRSSHVTLFGEAGVGGTIFNQVTTEGFNNDTFHDFGYVSVKAGLSVKF